MHKKLNHLVMNLPGQEYDFMFLIVESTSNNMIMRNFIHITMLRHGFIHDPYNGLLTASQPK